MVPLQGKGTFKISKNKGYFAESGKSSMVFVNEPGLYSLVLGRRKPEANLF